MSEPDESDQEHRRVPSATEPDADVEPHGGQVLDEWSFDGSYNDGNLDSRGVEPVAGTELDPNGEGETLDQDLDTSPRTDGQV